MYLKLLNLKLASYKVTIRSFVIQTARVPWGRVSLFFSYVEKCKQDPHPFGPKFPSWLVGWYHWHRNGLRSLLYIIRMMQYKHCESNHPQRPDTYYYDRWHKWYISHVCHILANMHKARTSEISYVWNKLNKWGLVENFLRIRCENSIKGVKSSLLCKLYLLFRYEVC